MTGQKTIGSYVRVFHETQRFFEMLEITAAGGSLILTLFQIPGLGGSVIFEFSSHTQNRRLLNQLNTHPTLDGTAMRSLFERISRNLSFKLSIEFMNTLWNK
jgi:hypothetical protein